MDPRNDQGKGEGSSGPEDSFFVHGMTVAPGAASPSSLPLPEPTDEFTFVRHIGHGGMGIVYEAVERASGRHVAVKVIAPGMRVSAEGFDRFKREARAAAAISHPSCVFVYGAHDVHGAPAIAMELMPGETVEDRIRNEQPVPSEDALRWTMEVLAGLEAVHERGLVHRDVKPANLFVGGDDRVKLGDFGLSRSFEGELGLTRTGIFLGSPLFASPEQVRGKELDPRSDLYSVGATLFCLLTGRAPFVSTTVGDLFARILTEDPPHPRDIVGTVPRGLDAIVSKALAKDPDDRFQSAGEMRRALARFSAEGVEPAPLGLRFAAGVLDWLLIEIMLILLVAGAHFAISPAESWKIDKVFGPAWFLLGVTWFTLFEYRRGHTPGKNLFGLRVADLSGGHPQFGHALTRASIILLPRAVLALFDDMWPLLPTFLLPFVTARQANGWRGVHELLSQTRTLRVRPVLAGVLRTRPFEPPRESLPAGQTIGVWTLEKKIAATAQGELLGARDPRLQRSVWIHRFADAASALDAKSRAREEGVRLCWLAGAEGFDVFTDPGGASVDEYARARRRLDWPLVRGILEQAIEETAREGRAIAVSRLWIDRRGGLRVLDFDLAPRRSPAASPISGIGELVRALLFPATDVDLAPRLVPDGGRRLLQRLAGQDRPYTDLDDLSAALARLGEAAHPVERGPRVFQIFLSASGRLVSLVLAVIVVSGLAGWRVDDEGFVIAPQGPAALAWIVGAWLLGVILPQTLLSLAFRGGPTFSVMRLRLVDDSGERASRTHCALRTLVALAPTSVALLGALAASEVGAHKTSGALLVAVPILALVQLAFAILSPSRGLSDAAVRTRIVH